MRPKHEQSWLFLLSAGGKLGVGGIGDIVTMLEQWENTQ
jgi:hypothetical protein